MRLKQEFSLFASLLIVSVIIGVSTAFFVYEKELLFNEMKANEINIFESFMEMSNEALTLHDELLLLNYIKSVKEINKNIVYIVFTSMDGNMLSAPYVLKEDVLIRKHEESLSGELLPVTYSGLEGEIYDIAQSVIMDGREIGVAQIGFSQDMLKTEIERTLNKTRKRILVIALFALAISILAAVLLANRMTLPIKQVIQGAKFIGDGHLDQSISVNSKNEFGDMAEEFNKMALKLKELDDMKDNFISSVSHELKSPLYHIKGHIDLFLMENKGVISTQSAEHFNVIKNNIKRLSDFISDILEMAKIKSRQLVINKKVCDIKKVAEEVIPLYMPTAAKHNISLTVSVPEGISRVTCDTEKITQVLHNLLGNAFKYTPDGGKIEIRAEEKGEHIEVGVCDSGIGIPADKVETVFEKFRQVKENQDKTGDIRGTGLGLAIVKGIIEAHGEKIWVESELDIGSSFIFTLSRKKNGSVSDECDSPADLIGEPVINKNILVIDDEEKLTAILKGFLTEGGSRVACIHSGREGLELAKETRPDMIILDLMMPGMDGFEVIRELKKNKATMNIPIIVLTSSASEKNREKCLALGACECLDKASYEDIIIRKIEINLRKGEDNG
ncbi:MAG: ATP-binding protein [Elusimicrobiota bacterium]